MEVHVAFNCEFAESKKSKKKCGKHEKVFAQLESPKAMDSNKLYNLWEGCTK